MPRPPHPLNPPRILIGILVAGSLAVLVKTLSSSVRPPEPRKLDEKIAIAPTDNTMAPKSYADDPAWSDITPIPQDEGGEFPLAAIAYAEEYSEAMSYLRAVMAKNEFSERVLSLTEHVIGMNPAHYTVWLYRSKTLISLNADLREELTWLNETALKHLKNYQIWHHRQIIVEKLNSPEGETDFIATMLVEDNKNYHVWSYRQWLVKRFQLWEGPEAEKELKWTESMIDDDVRNNSAWNHRWFVVFGALEGKDIPKDVAEREIAYAKEAIRKAPQNQSPWNYIRGVVRRAQLPTSTLKDFATQFANLEQPDEIHSSHALDLLAGIYAEEKDKKADAAKALELLATKYDPVKAHYWNYRKGLLEQPSTVA